MLEQSPHGMRRQGLDRAFEAEEARKSMLISEAQVLRAQQHTDSAAVKFAQAAEIEEHLSAICEERELEERELIEKALVHRFSALSCWAQAGNFHAAITLGDELLGRTDLPQRLRQRVQDYTEVLRRRRAEWSAGLVLAADSTES